MTGSSKKGRHQAFALIATMAAIAVAMLLLAAFLQANRSFLTLSSLDEDRQACRQVLDSLAELCRFRLEEERSWRVSAIGEESAWDGSEEIALPTSRVLFELTRVRPGVKVVGHGLKGHRHILGRSPSLGVEFHIAFTNNLESRTGQEFELENGSERVPPKTCYLRLSASRGGHTEQMEITLRKAAFFDSTLASSGAINIRVRDREGADNDLDRVVFADPVRNQIRSETSITLPNSKSLKFRPDADSNSPIKGTLWSKGEIRIGQARRAKELAKVAERHRIEVIEQAKNHYNVPELTADDIEVGATTPVSLKSKKYVFSEAHLTFEPAHGGPPVDQVVRVLKQFDSSTGMVEKFYYNSKDLPTAKSGTVRIVPVTDKQRETIPPNLYGSGQDGHRFRIDNDKIRVELRGEDFEGGGEAARARSEPRFVLPKAATVDGSFEVSADSMELVPTISFGENEKKGYLSTKDTLILEGYLRGGGKIVSREGNVRLYPNDVDVRSDKTTELAVFAGRDVIISPPANENAGLIENSRVRDLYFRGLVYATNNFTFRSARENREGEIAARFDRRLLVEGAVVARNGAIDIHSRLGVKLTYNPDYLDDFLEKSFLDQNAQVEEISRRPL